MTQIIIPFIKKKGVSEDILQDGSNWKFKLQSFTSFTSIKDYATKIVNEIRLHKGDPSVSSFPLEPSQSAEYLSYISKDLQELENDYQVRLNAYQNQLASERDKITNLQKMNKDYLQKTRDLTFQKEELDNKIKQEKDRFLNHKCNTPNQNELNQIKQELREMTADKNQLEAELRKRPDSPPSPADSNKKEEEWNDKLNLEELRVKLRNQKEELDSLKNELDHAKKEVSSKPTAGNLRLFLGIGLGSLMLIVVRGLIILYHKKKLSKK